MFCPLCLHKTHTREIGIKDFGRLPHLGLAVLAVQSADGSEFLKSVWSGLSGKDGNVAELHVEYADQSSLPEFENLVQASISSPTELLRPRRRKIGTWVWRISSARRKNLLYIHQLGRTELDDENKFQLFETISGLAFVVSSRSESGDAESVIGEAKRILESRFRSFQDRLRVPVAIVVQDCANGKDAEEIIEDRHNHLKRLIKNAFVPVRIFGEGESAKAFKWLIAKSRTAQAL